MDWYVLNKSNTPKELALTLLRSQMDMEMIITGEKPDPAMIQRIQTLANLYDQSIYVVSTCENNIDIANQLLSTGKFSSADIASLQAKERLVKNFIASASCLRERMQHAFGMVSVFKVKNIQTSKGANSKITG